MAPAMKRPAAKESSAAPQKKAKLHPAQEQISAVEVALEGCEKIPASVRTLFAGSVAMSLGIMKEDRHEFQNEFVHMIGEVLEGVAADKQAQLSTAQANMDRATCIKQDLDANCAKASDKMHAIQAEVAESESAVQEAASALETSIKAVEDATTKAASLDAEITVLSERVKELRGIRVAVTGDEPMDKKAIQEVNQVGASLELDKALLKVLPTVLGKAASHRTTFENFTTSTLVDNLSKHIEAGEKEIAGSAGEKQARAAAVQAAEAQRETATALKEARDNSRADARERLAESKALLSAAKMELKAHRAAMNDLKGEMSYAQADLARYTNGTLAAYMELRDLTAEVPELEPEPVVQEAEAGEAVQESAPVAAAPPAQELLFAAP